MAGLSLISTYSSDSESEEEREISVNPQSIENEITVDSLPLPDSIASWKGVTHHKEVIDDPSKHDGRVRSFKHERGNWATLVYLEYKPSDNVRSWMNSVCEKLLIEGNLLFQQFHISLTRSLILKFHWIESFVEGLKKLFQNTNRFVLEFVGIKVYCNEDKTRTFLGMCCDNKDLNHLTIALNKLLAEYQLPSFYEDASHHVSFLWNLGDNRKRLEPLIPSLTSSFNNLLACHSEENYIHVDQIHCKIGNRMYIFPLK